VVRSRSLLGSAIALGIFLVTVVSCGQATRRTGQAAHPPGKSSTTTTSVTATPISPSTSGSPTTSPPVVTVPPTTSPAVTASPTPTQAPTTVAHPPVSTSPTTEPGASQAAWCGGGALTATAGPTEPFAGNGARISVTLHETNLSSCLVPASVEVRLTNAAGATETEALSTPGGSSTLAIGPSTAASLSLTWVRQGCFTPSVNAAGGYLLWSTPPGAVEVIIAGIAADQVAPCHDAFGITNLQS
jgi:hypothetical protein